MDRPLLRIIDANANRASEAARVLEDAARFVLADAALAARCKALRHAIRSTLAVIDASAMLASRDTPSDVGTQITGATESLRRGLGDVCTAAAKRLGEALRVLEECVKIFRAGDTSAATLKALRYEAYELEKRIVPAISRPRRQWSLCVLITEALCTQLPWHEVARRAVAGGADCLQLREKSLPAAELLSRAVALVELSRQKPGPGGAPVDIIINDRPDIALASGATGVHLGQDDLPVAAARDVLHPRMLIGVSTSSLGEAQRAFTEGADYVGLGPMFKSDTKAKERLAGAEYLREFVEWDRARVQAQGGEPFPHLAISGIDASRAGQLASAGCAGVAVSSVVCSSAEPEKVCADILNAIQVVADRSRTQA